MKDDRLLDIILPLAIADVFTYRVDEGMDVPAPGMRVLVPLGKKSITGVVYRRHEGAMPEHITLRSIQQVLDATPIVTVQQLRLWQWLADYYMCSLGEVLAAALPAGIIDDDYTALTTQTIRLHPTYHDPAAWQKMLDSLSRAKAQAKLLRSFAALAPLDGEVTRRELLEHAGVSSSVLRILIDKQVFCEEQRTISRLRQYTGVAHPPHALDAQQDTALQAIYEAWQQKDVCLLHGVTSSGKTEVYIHLIEQMLQAGKQVLYLVPEIALTTQLTERLQAVFGNDCVVYHSRFSAAERVEIYGEIGDRVSGIGNRISDNGDRVSEIGDRISGIGYRVSGIGERISDNGDRGRGKVVLGARSAIFLPFQNLGMIIVDEEHEPSYKQQDPAPRYHARSAAIMMAQWYGAKVLLGTATPSIESYYNAMSGKYGYVAMTQRFQGLELPHISLIDLQKQYHKKEMYGHFSDPLVFRIREELAQGKQVILFQNRRGYAPYLQCKKCGSVPSCPNCDVSMTYHKGKGIVVCHCCGYAMHVPAYCPDCKGDYRTQGFGTERLEEEIQQLFPLARVARMDLDTTRKKDSHQQLIDRFAAHEVDILIGTQMVTKGLHFDDVSLVAVLQADSLLHQPNFRSYEHAFQMLEQVSGRAGRKGKKGEVLLQTFDTKNPIYHFVKEHDYPGFYAQQLAERELFHFPPFYRIIYLTLKHHDMTRLETAAQCLQERLKQSFGQRVSGIIQPSVGRVQNMHVRHIRLSIEASASIVRAKAMLRDHITWVQQQPAGKGTHIYADVDPQ